MQLWVLKSGVAINESKSLLRKSPKDEIALTNLATAYAMKRDYERASYYGGLLEKYHGKSSDSLNLKGLAILNSTNRSFSDYYRAINYFRSSYKLDSKQVASGLNLGFLYLDLSKNNEANNIFTDVAERCKNCCSQSLIGRGIALSRLGELAMAERTFRLAIKKEDDVRAQYYLALINYYEKKDLSKAKYFLKKVVNNDEKDNYEIKRKGCISF